MQVKQMLLILSFLFSFAACNGVAEDTTPTPESESASVSESTSSDSPVTADSQAESSQQELSLSSVPAQASLTSEAETEPTDEELITHLVYKHYEALRTGDLRAMSELRTDPGSMYAPDEDIAAATQAMMEYAAQTIADIQVQSVQIRKEGPSNAVAAVTYDHVMAQTDLDRLFTRIHNITYEDIVLEKQDGSWKISWIADTRTEEQVQRDKAYMPYSTLWEHLDTVLSKDQHGFIEIVDKTSYAEMTDFYFPFRYQLVIPVVDRAAVENTVKSFSDEGLDIVYLETDYSETQILEIIQELEKSAIRKYLDSVALSVRDNGVAIVIKEKQYERQVLDFLQGMDGGDAVTYQVGPLPEVEGTNPGT